jgi:predicted kinase
VWDHTKQQNNGFPRYVEAFLNPEYDHLKDKKVDDYISDSKIVTKYKGVQNCLRDYLVETNKMGFQRGFGFGDVKPGNLVLDDRGNAMFIDVGKPAFNYHWLTHFGQYYHDVVKKFPKTKFSSVVQKQALEILKSFENKDLGMRLFILGRLNRDLIGLTLRNIVFFSEINKPVDENIIKLKLPVIEEYTKITDVNYAVIYGNGEFDSNWRERLSWYKETDEYKDTLNILMEEFKSKISEVDQKSKQKNKYLVIFMGIPGSGKSTIAELITELIPSVILRSDYFYFDRLNDLIAGDYYKAYVYKEGLAGEFLKEGTNVILDDNNRTVKNRRGAYDLAEKFDAIPVFINIKVDVEIAAKRRTMKGGETIPWEQNVEAVRRFEAQLEFPTIEEKEIAQIIEVNGSEPLETIKETLKRELQT